MGLLGIQTLKKKKREAREPALKIASVAASLQSRSEDLKNRGWGARAKNNIVARKTEV